MHVKNNGRYLIVSKKTTIGNKVNKIQRKKEGIKCKTTELEKIKYFFYYIFIDLLDIYSLYFNEVH
jgi:hypothetical protein